MNRSSNDALKAGDAVARHEAQVRGFRPAGFSLSGACGVNNEWPSSARYDNSR
jgi:hypothetical protein